MGYSMWEIAKAFIDDNFELAVDLYTQAIVVDPNNAELYSDRAQANIKSNNLTEAVENLMGSSDLLTVVCCFWRNRNSVMGN